MMGKGVDIVSRAFWLSLSSKNSHDYWIRKALRLAQKAYTLGEVPVGALIIKDNRVIGQGFNQRRG